MMSCETIKITLREKGKNREPFFLVLNFEATHGYIFSLDELKNQALRIQFPNFEFRNNLQPSAAITLEKFPLSLVAYQQGFQLVQEHLRYGNSFLTNLTCQTPIVTEADLDQLYATSKAKYKIQCKDEWVCFSPETFIQIRNNQLFSFPMKGTIDASISHAQELLLADEKETAEHYTIVDLLRNDMSMVARNVQVKRFRYLDKIKTRTKDLWQMSSELVADLNDDYLDHLDEIIFTLLPAGSISGAPKQKTLDIIREAENYSRGFYTGTAFYFDGQNLDSCVLIRFIEQTPQGLVYKSGGGITTQSTLEQEYEEMIAKIYLPI
ncbi:MAG: aminodeoxychorismate synthase component I [Chitinophagaceae bacterium]|nr:aminodeoxychorismate synthase component I [Chitinophagaceae bacterium]